MDYTIGVSDSKNDGVEGDLFGFAMRDVVPLEKIDPTVPARSRSMGAKVIRPPQPRELHSDAIRSAEGAPLPLYGWIANGVSRKTLRRLRQRDPTPTSQIDLHGHTLEQAQAAVVRFVGESCAAGHRCVLIVHGRGLHSASGVSLIKRNLVSWLTVNVPSGAVLAVCAAKAVDGGDGASYVLLSKKVGGRRQ